MDSLSLPSRMTRRSRIGLFLAWTALVVIGFLIISIVARQEVIRQRQAWEQRLDLLSASQARAVSAWIVQRRDALGGLADNMSLKLYLTQLSSAENGSFEEPAELTFLRNLVLSTAANNGFGSLDEPTIRANIPAEPGSGIRLDDAAGKLLVATRNMPTDDLLPKNLNDRDSKNPAMAGPFALGSGPAAVAFRQPVFPVQGEDAPIARLTAVALLDERFFRLLETPVASAAGSESLLISRSEEGYAALSSRGATSESSRSPLFTKAAGLPGQLVEERNLGGQNQYAVANTVEGAPGWLILRRVDQSAALSDAVQRSRWWRLSYLLAAALVTAAVIAFWRHQSAIRAKEAARHYRHLAFRIEQQEQMLTLIAETTPVATYIVDEEGLFRYANRRAAEEWRMARSDLEGKKLNSILGTAKAEAIETANAKALATEESQHTFDEDLLGDTPLRSVAREHIPLRSVPLSGEARIPGVLVLETDVTSLVQSRERERRTLSQLIRTLVSLVDKRDPHAAHHSTCVSLVAHAVAETMKLPAPMPETAKIAGQLVNLGKILVPESLLTSTSLDSTDKEKIREAIHETAELLKDVPFDGPVTETIRQSQEMPDGSGPLGFQGDDILVSARIVTVANAFVALISARAWREGNSMDQALKVMLDGIGTRFDRGAVAALVTYVESGRGQKDLAVCTDSPKKETA